MTIFDTPKQEIGLYALRVKGFSGREVEMVRKLVVDDKWCEAVAIGFVEKHRSERAMRDENEFGEQIVKGMLVVYAAMLVGFVCVLSR